MTRKKSNVKALALAVTCAILAGGGIGLEPVYASDVTYDASSNQLKNGTTAIDTLTVGGVTIGGSGAITADSLALTGTDGTTNVGAAIKDNANNIQDVNGKVTNIQTDVTSLQTTTGQLQTRVGELTASDTAARNDIISLQKKTAGISEDGSEITTKSLKLRESGSLEEQEITAAKVKGYDEAVVAVGDTSTEGTLAYNTQKIKFKKDNKITSEDATYIEGITHAGDVRLANGEVRAKSIVLEEVFDNGTSGQATLTRESIVNLHGMIDGKTKIKVADGSEVGGVMFDQGKVTNVVSINDNLKFESDGIYLNKGDQAKQIKIGTDGKIIIGTSSSAYDTNGFYAGGDDYDNAKAGMKSDGSLKATGFAVDGATGNTTVGGNLTVNGAATFDQETAFAGGIKTDKISEKTPNAGVTVDGNLHANKNAFVKGMLTVDGDAEVKKDLKVKGNIQGKDITATGALKGQTLGIGGTDNDQFTVDVNGAVKAVGGKVTIDKDGNAQFGDTGSNITKIQGNKITTGYIQTDNNIESSIGGVKMKNGQITADSMTINGNIDLNNLKVKDTLTVGTNTKITEGTLQLGTAEDNKLTAEKLANINQTIKANRVIDATSATIGGVEIKGGNVTATGTVQGQTIYDGVGAKLENGKITAKEGQIGNVTISAAGEVTGVKSIEASTFKVDEDNYLNNNGITAKGGHIGGAVIDATTLTVGVTKLDSTEGITTNKLKIAGMTLTGTNLDTGTADFQVNGVTFNQGKVTAQADKGFVAGTSSFKQDSLIVDANNKLEATSGLTTKKATVNGTLDVTDKATFGTVGKQTTINGDVITTDTLKANKLILGASGDTTVEVDKDGSLKAADGAFTVAKDGKTTFKKDADNLSSINGGNIWAKATDAANHTSSELLHTYKGLHVEGTQAGKTSAFDFDTSTGIGTFTGQDNSTTAIDGSNMTLVNGDNKTELTAGGVTFTGKDYKDATAKGTTVIDGNTITTGKLVTDELVITGKGNADGNGGSIAFGGNGTIKSDINDGTTNGKNTSFETTLDGVNTKVTNGTTTTENNVSAAGNSNTVKQDDTHKSEFNQGLTSIGGVVTNGEIKVAQKLDGATGLLTNEVTDANGSSKLEQSGTGLTYTDSANAGNATRIDSSDVSIGSATEPDKRINLSDLGQIDELDKEIRDNEVYKNNETAVGGINAEAAIRRGEVERLDNRISEEVTRLDGRINDVSDRVNKVGAMAAAIASLKSIGYDPQAPSEFSIGLGQYKGETGVAMGFFHYPNKNFMINVSLSTAGGETMGGIGATWRFGHKSPQKLLEEQREAQAKKELAAAEKYQAAAKLAKEAQERAEYAAKLARQAQVSADNAKAAADATQAKHFG